jgi:hypothetical protein
MRMLTLEQAKELQSSESWQGVLSELDSRTQVCFQQMTNCKAEDLVKYQAKLQVYNEVRGILQAVIDREE